MAGKQKRTVGFDILAAMVMKSTVFWDTDLFLFLVSFLVWSVTESTWYSDH
jgi:hypothetical protein